jgi:UDP-N-acetylmuramoylalanine--D-glutamate ligase
MPLLTSWSELADATVGVWGLGVEGSASVRKLRTLGVTPILVDDNPDATGVDGLEVLATVGDGLKALTRCDVVVKGPGISRYRSEVAALEQAGVAVRGGLGLWLEEVDRSRIACITGTKGKSTTTALCVHLLHHLGHRAAAGGNIGRPPWDPDGEEEGPPPDYWIIETSSFQVPDVTTAPPIVAVTSLSPDHLDWHGTVERYYADKLSLCTKPGVALALVEGTDPQLRQQLGALGPSRQWVGPETTDGAEAVRGALRLPGDHNGRNALMARAVLRGLGAADADDDGLLADGARSFPGLPSRCRSLGQIDGIEFVDDSLSTNVLPAQAALAAFADRPVALLVGGKDRGLDYEPLGHTVAEREPSTLVVTLPDNGPRIGAAIAHRAGARVTVIDAPDLDRAVRDAFEWASTGAVILLSPAAPSFGHYTDYRDRAQAFAAAAARCGTLSS